MVLFWWELYQSELIKSSLVTLFTFNEESDLSWGVPRLGVLGHRLKG